MKLKATPSDWEKVLGFTVLDPDGWFDTDWNTPITFDDFFARCGESTLIHCNIHRNLTLEDYREIARKAI